MNRISFVIALLLFALIVGSTADASACAVCYGDGKSELVQGVKAGVIFLAVFVYGLLSLIGAVLLSWYFRARKLAALEAEAQAAVAAGDSPA